MAETKLDETLIMDRTGEVSGSVPDDVASRRVAHYNIKREIGRGALSVVYEAEDTYTGQNVALKLLTLSSSLTPLEAEALIARFEREARTAARLSHPNIVHIHEVGAEKNQHFLAMEYLKGQTLRRWMGEGTLPLPEVFAILTQIAGALDAVHKAGIVHRDVKPTNIILLPDGTAKLLDFGIARSSKETVITHRGMIVGSPSYMAPEQIKGDAGTKATDIWALGVLSCELLAGHLPFTGRNVGGVMFQIMHEPPAPMPDLPQAVQKALLRALDKRPSQRYPTASALVQALKLAYPKQMPAAPEQKAAAFPKPTASPKQVKLPPAAFFPLPGPKWMPEATLLGLFLLGFSGAYLARLHTGSHTQKAAASLTAARNPSPPTPVFLQAPAPPRVLAAPQPQAASPDTLPDTVPAAAYSAPAMPLQAQKEPQDHQVALPSTRSLPPSIRALPAVDKAPVMQAKQAAAPVRLLHTAQAIAAVPVQPHRSPARVNSAASRQTIVPVVSAPQSAMPASPPAPIQVASRHVPVVHCLGRRLSRSSGLSRRESLFSPSQPKAWNRLSLFLPAVIAMTPKPRRGAANPPGLKRGLHLALRCSRQ